MFCGPPAPTAAGACYYRRPVLLLMDHMVSDAWVEECRESAFVNVHTSLIFLFLTS